MTVLDARRDVAAMQIQRRQDGARSQSLVFVVARHFRMLAGNRRQVWRGIADGLQSRLFTD